MKKIPLIIDFLKVTNRKRLTLEMLLLEEMKER